VAIQILIVDDSALVRQVVKKIVRQTGLEAEFHEASDGIQALDSIRTASIELVISDINMPNMDGLEMLAQLRSMPEQADLPVIVVSTEGSDETVRRAMELGANGYVYKPFTPEQLAEKLLPLGLVPQPVFSDAVDLSDPTAF